MNNCPLKPWLIAAGEEPNGKSQKMKAPPLDTSKSNNSKSLNASVTGVGALILLSSLSRVGTFLLNLAIHRLVSYRTLGLLFDAELWMSTALFMLREPFRMGLLRASSILDEGSPVAASPSNARPTTPSPSTQRVLNLSLIPYWAALLFISCYWLLCSVAFRSSAPPAWLLGGSFTSSSLFCLAVLIELASEPLYAILQLQLMYHLRVRVEVCAFIIQCISTYATLLYTTRVGDSLNEDTGLLCFALAQSLRATCLLMGYYWVMWRHGLTSSLALNLPGLWIPRRIKSTTPSYFLDPTLLSISLTFILQSAIKHVLTVGDRIALIALGIPTDHKGVYRLVSDLGSLVARILFQPLEETSRGLFSKLLVTSPSSYSDRDSSQSKTFPKPEQLLLSAQILSAIVKLQLYFGLFFIFFGPNYAEALLAILYRKSNVSSLDSMAGSILATYCFYVPIMGVNGITEAFLQSVGDASWLRRQAIWMILFWMGFMGSCYITMVVLDLGTAGLAWSNCLNLLLRIIFSCTFIVHFYTCATQSTLATRSALRSKSNGVSHSEVLALIKPTAFLPHFYVVVPFIICGGITSITRKSWSFLPHLGTGIVLGLVCLMLIYMFERNDLLKRLSYLRAESKYSQSVGSDSGSKKID